MATQINPAALTGIPGIARRLVIEGVVSEDDARKAVDASNKQKIPLVSYLVQNGLAHRIRRLNAFTACMHPGQAHSPAFLICRSCHTVAEAAAAPVRAALDVAAAGLGFAIERSNVEASGLCPACQSVPA